MGDNKEAIARRRHVLGDGRAQQEIDCITQLPLELVDTIAQFDFGTHPRIDGDKTRGHLELPPMEKKDYAIKLADAIGAEAARYEEDDWEKAGRGLSFVRFKRYERCTNWVWILGCTKETVAQMMPDNEARKLFYQLPSTTDCHFIVVDDFFGKFSYTKKFSYIQNTKTTFFTFACIDQFRKKHLAPK